MKLLFHSHPLFFSVQLRCRDLGNIFLEICPWSVVVCKEFTWHFQHVFQDNIKQVILYVLNPCAVFAIVFAYFTCPHSLPLSSSIMTPISSSFRTIAWMWSFFCVTVSVACNGNSQHLRKATRNTLHKAVSAAVNVAYHISVGLMSAHCSSNCMIFSVFK